MLHVSAPLGDHSVEERGKCFVNLPKLQLGLSKTPKADGQDTFFHTVGASNLADFWTRTVKRTDFGLVNHRAQRMKQVNLAEGARGENGMLSNSSDDSLMDRLSHGHP